MRKLLMFFLVLCVANMARAQVSAATFRLLGGFSVPNYTYALNGTSDSRDAYPGFSGGLMLSVYSDEPGANNTMSLGVHLAMNYTQKGAINKNLFGQGQLQADNRITYLQGDALGSIGFGKNRRKGSFVDFCVGPYLSYALNGEQQLKLTNGTSTNTKFNFGTSTSDDFIQFDLGLKTGLLCTLSSRFTIAAMYEYGLSDIAPQEALKIQNRNFLVSAGINFGYKKR